MVLLLDTNILINIGRSKNPKRLIKYLNPNDDRMYVSVATEAEIRSFAFQNNWGLKRMGILEEFFLDATIVDIGQLYVNIYIQIDSYSQRANPAFKDYNFKTPRNMGKNDVWIAALATFLGLKLITTDSDFDHLNGVFFEVRKIKPSEFVAFL